MKFSVCKIISLFIKLLGSFLVLFSSVSAFHYKHKKIVNFILFVLEVLDYLISK